MPFISLSMGDDSIFLNNYSGIAKPIKKIFSRKNIDIGKQMGEVWFYLVRWRHHMSKKDVFICPSVTLYIFEDETLSNY